MAQILEQGPRNAVLKFHAAETFALSQLSTLQSYQSVRYASIESIWYDVGAATDVQVQWDTTTSFTPPVLSNVTTSAAGGTLAAGTYYYVVTALFAGGGESPRSNEGSVVTTGATSSNTINWAAVTGATGYRVYRGTAAGLENTYFAVGAVTTFLDVGAAGTAGTPPTNGSVINSLALTLSGREDMCFEVFGGIVADVPNGTITAQAIKIVGTAPFTIILKLKKSY